MAIAQHVFKIMLIGDADAGKTSLISRFCDDKFDPSQKNSINLDFCIKLLHFGDQKVRLLVWDTVGQERYLAITRQYYRKADAILLVYDVTRSESFDHISMWAQVVKMNASSDVAVFLVGNKTDLVGHRKITTEQGRQLGKSLQMPFIETSAKSGENVDKMFNDAALFLLRTKRITSNQQSPELGNKPQKIKLQDGAKKTNQNGGQCCGSQKANQNTNNQTKPSAVKSTNPFDNE